MRIATLLQLAEIHSQFLYLRRNLHIIQIDHFQCLSPTDNSYFFVVQINNLIRIFDNRCRIRSQKEFIIADSHNKRAAFTGCNYLIRVVLGNHSNGISSNELLQGQLHGSTKVCLIGFHDVFDEIYNHLRIRTAAKFISFTLQLGTNHTIVLDNTVMYHGQFSGGRVMGMGIYIVGFAVSGPACMRYTDRT